MLFGLGKSKKAVGLGDLHLIQGRRSGFWNQLFALLWRNYLLKKTEKAKTFWEIVMPLLMVASLMSIKSGLKPASKPAHPTPLGHVRLITPSHLAQLTTEIMVAPNTPQVVQFMDQVMEFLNTNTYTTGFNYSLHNNSLEMETMYKDRLTTSNIGIVFPNEDLRTHGSYVLRFPLKALPNPKTMVADMDTCRVKHFTFSSDPMMCPAATYYSSGFSVLQAAIDYTFMKLWLNRTTYRLPDLVIKLLPKPVFTDPGTTWRSLVPLYMTLAFSPFVSVLCVNIVLEKERKIKEGMLMMGMKITAYWTAWFIVEALIVLIVACIMTIVVFALQVLPNSDCGLVFMLTSLYGCSIVMFSFMLTPFFNKSKVAGSVVGLLVLFLSLFYMLAVFFKDSISSLTFYLLSLLSPACFAFGMEKMSEMDIHGGMHYSDLFVGQFSVGSCIIMLMVDIVLYGLIALYLDRVVPSDYSQNLSPFWFLCGDYSNEEKKKKVEVEMISYGGGKSYSQDIEERPSELHGKEAIKVSGLQKVFSRWGSPPVTAVDGINLMIHEGQICALLGHNGAGKSTLISMLVGTTPPTKGTATVYGYDITDPVDMANIRSMMGVCLQEDILFDTLSPRQHLVFFAMLKGIPRPNIPLAVKDIICEFDLEEKADLPSSKLSGGQKRKLSVAIALIGDPKIVFLDEPSSGMDPYSRRHLWNELQKRKEDKVIVLTTHFMDEADILAVIEPGADRNQITRLVQHFVPSSTIYRTITTEMSYILPMNSTAAFAGLFSAIEEQISAEQFGITSYGVSMTTLEEVFLRMGENSEDESTETGKSDTTGLRDMDKMALTEPPGLSDAYPNALQSFLAFYKVRILLFIRTPMHVVPLLILPAIMIVLSYCLLSRDEIPTNAMLTFDNRLYHKFNNVVQVFSQTVQPAGWKVWQDLLKRLNMTTLFKNGSVLSSTLENNITNLYAQLIDSVAANIKDAEALTILINDTYLHTLPILQSATFNGLLAIANTANRSLPLLQTTSYPWPERSISRTFDPHLYTWIMMISVLMAYMPSLIAVEVVEDRQHKIKNQLRVSGLLFFGYWNTVLMSHVTVFLGAVLLMIVTIMVLGVPFLTEPMAIIATLILFGLYIPSSLIACYCITHLFNKHETAKGVLPFFCLLCSMFPSVPVTILDMIDSKETATVIHGILSFLLPFYIPNGGLYYIVKTSIEMETFRSAGFPVDRFAYFRWENNVMITYVASILHIMVLYVVLRVLDVAKAGGRIADAFSIGVRAFDITPNSDLPEKEDSDVKAERKRIAQMDLSLMSKAPVVYINEMRKVYESGTSCRGKRHVKIAVRNLSMAVETGDIFGLLGPNGAGKSSTIKVVVGEEMPSSGRVAVAGHEITSNISKAFKMMGYCPQHDALWNNLTVREHLRLFAALRGIRYSNIKEVTTWLLERLRITEHADKKVKTLSGGTKRKLSYAISTLGCSSIVLLDEPSTGMDPQSKRFLWDTISRAFPAGGERGALLTTHSMEEADVLCSRVGIMVKGALRCLGSTQHLKNKYGAGYTLDVKMYKQSARWRSNLNELRAYIHEVFPESQLREGFQDRLTYDIPQLSVSSLSSVFKAMEDAKANFEIEEFSFSQTTLEQVFLNFAKEQENEEDDPYTQA